MLVAADSRRIPLPDESVQCVVTSPPYWGLRKYAGEQELTWPAILDAIYDRSACCPHDWTEETFDKSKPGTNGSGLTSAGASQARSNRFTSRHGTCRRCGAWRGAYGLEPAVGMYVQHTVEILREIRRVLRPDGVVFWNIGDSYHNGDKGGYAKDRIKAKDSMQRSNLGANFIGAPNRQPQLGLKPKDLCLIPERMALAAQADGWYVRSRILWCKPNPMPESVRDRPTDAAEHIWMFTKSARYFWDAEAVREMVTSEYSLERGKYPRGDARDKRKDDDGCPDYLLKGGYVWPSSRNLRNVWTFPTQPYKGAHFATFPEELPRRCILAATSARGACRFCGTPWERVVRPTAEYAKKLAATSEQWFQRAESPFPDGKKQDNTFHGISAEYQTIGWQPGCRCPGQHGVTVPCLVLDPFGGSGTTARVATELNRRAVSLDIAYAHPTGYAALADVRTRGVQRNLPI
jgi:DNA modification methylase